MKILMAHNFYGSSAPSGENTVFEAEKKLLEEHGHQVSTLTRHSDEIRRQGLWGAIKGGASTPWNSFSYRGLKKKLATEKPDILHVHNFFPLLSPAIFHAAKNTGTATVLTLHNYRLFCAAGIPMRGGRPCTSCLDRRSVLPALRHKCYRHSYPATLALAAMIGLHRFLSTWSRHVDAFIVLTRFQKELMAAAGLPEDRLHVKPHFYDNPPIPHPWRERSRRVAYIGRLGEEKGIRILLEAWRQWGRQCPELDIVGDGPLRGELQAVAEGAGLGGKVHFWGQLSFAETQERLARAELLVLPSLCFEGFPMVIREAFALGVPVAASRLGAIPCIVNDGENGVLVEPGSGPAFYHAVKAIWNDHEALERLGRKARAEFEGKYTAEANHGILMEIYGKAISNRGTISQAATRGRKI